VRRRHRQRTRNQWVCSGSGEYEVEVDKVEEEISIDAQGHVARRALNFDDPDPLRPGDDRTSGRCRRTVRRGFRPRP
jgi:hypothetical protein